MSELPKNFKYYFDEVITIDGWDRTPDLGIEYLKAEGKNFSPIDASIRWETNQINKYMKMELKPDDIMFIADLSFPGLFPNILHHKRPKKVFMFCHGTSLNYLDYFESTAYSKKQIEKAHSDLADAVFVGSYYHKRKLIEMNHIITTPLPYPQFNTFRDLPKKYDLISVSRPTAQKVDLDFEKRVEEHFGTKIIRPGDDIKTWEDYYKFVGRAKAMIITAKEETFGYQVVDAAINNCVPVAPNRYSYFELLQDVYRYNNFKEAVDIIQSVFDGRLKPPYLKCSGDMANFFKNISEHMKG